MPRGPVAGIFTHISEAGSGASPGPLWKETCDEISGCRVLGVPGLVLPTGGWVQVMGPLWIRMGPGEAVAHRVLSELVGRNVSLPGQVLGLSCPVLMMTDLQTVLIN